MFDSSVQNIWFTADWHVYSKNIIGYCNRPFNSVEEMNNTLISNFNNKVKKGDICYMLGDMCWGHNNYNDFFKQLNGEKFIILGNHDTEQKYKKLLIDHVISGLYKVKNINIDGCNIFLSHYAHRTWNMSHRGGYHFWGHSHNTLCDYGLSCDVGADKWNYNPVSWFELKEYLSGRDKHYNLKVRDDYSYQRNNFELHFTDKYKERVEKEALILENLL